jgi:phosphoenolpyruvate carboxykinase (ATP)
MNFNQKIEDLISNHPKAQMNMSRELLIYNAVKLGKAIVTWNGALATWSPAESTGRSPKDTLIVKRESSEKNMDWNSPNNIPLDEETFSMIFEDAIDTLKNKYSFYVLDRVLGADSSYALPVRTITDKAFSGVFVDNMFRPVPNDIEKSVFADKSFTLIALPYDKLDENRYKGRLRRLPNGKTTNMVVAMDFDNRIGIVYGSAYLGSMKKLMFTVMNYYLPEYNILPLHCSATELPNGESTLFLGLSGTGKTTLSSAPHMALIGDDEHGWNDTGIANFENGCYAKMINLDKIHHSNNSQIDKDCYPSLQLGSKLTHKPLFHTALQVPNHH